MTMRAWGSLSLALMGIGCSVQAEGGEQSMASVVAAASSAGTYQYAFDPSGLSASIGGGGASYDVTRRGDDLTAGADRYHFDSQGRVVAIDELAIAYAPDGEIDHATRGAQTVSYVYDEEGRRILKKTNGVPTAAYAEEGYVTQTELDEPVRVAGRLVGMLANAMLVFAPTDMRGTVQGDTDGTLRIASPFGARPVHPDMAAALDYAANGFDADLGAERMGVRDYDPRIARFLQPDPYFLEHPEKCVQSPSECNLYGYARNAPLDYLDPSGKASETSEPTPPSTPPLDEMVGKTEPASREDDLHDLLGIETMHNVFRPGDSVELKAGPPGTQQYTRDGAALAALFQAATRSYFGNREYAGLIYKNPNNTYSFTPAARGYTASSYPHNAEDHVPRGATIVGWYHTHGGPDPRYDNEEFSGASGDRGVSQYDRTPGYVVTPGGHYGVIYPLVRGTKSFGGAIGRVCGFWCDHPEAISP